MEIKRRDLIKTFWLTMSRNSKKFYGNVVVNDGEFEIKGETKEYDTPEEALTEMKELLVKIYVKSETIEVS